VLNTYIATLPLSCNTVVEVAPTMLTSMAMEPHPWLRPVERRVGVAVLCALWLGFESYYDMGGLWFWLALGATAYAIWDFFLSGSYRDASE
jgi:hypothetical protein